MASADVHITHFFSKFQYDSLVSPVERMKKRTDRLKRSAMDYGAYGLLKKHDVLGASRVDKLIVPVIADNGIQYNLHNDDAFNVPHKVHFIGHDGRNGTEYETSNTYKNTTKDAITLYLNNYKLWQKKNSAS